jgi:2-polyprenyl-6-methoxyphenol hydroxylase-like FAD-dependent oxidoreductase
MSHSPHPALVIGAGIGGLAAAIALRQRGMEALVVERAEELREVGAGLLLSPNACAVLERLGVLVELGSNSASVPRWDLLNQKGELLSSLQVAQGDEQSLNTRRCDLQMALRRLLPVDAVRLGCAAVKAENRSGVVEVTLGDGSVIRASRIVVADGTHSAIRSQLWPKRRVTYRGYIGWRALVDHVPSGWESGHVSESWGRGRRFGIGHVGGGRTYWYASANVVKSKAQDAIALEQLQRDFGDWHDPIAELFSHTRQEALLQHPIADSRPHWHWQQDNRIALLGDTAHPLTPNLGQGAAMALEDAWELAQQWNHPDAFARYERRRRARLLAVWAASRWVGTMIQWQNPLLCAARDAHLRLLPNTFACGMIRLLLMR